MCDREAATARGCHLGYTDTLSTEAASTASYKKSVGKLLLLRTLVYICNLEEIRILLGQIDKMMEAELAQILCTNICIKHL